MGFLYFPVSTSVCIFISFSSMFKYSICLFIYFPFLLLPASIILFWIFFRPARISGVSPNSLLNSCSSMFCHHSAVAFESNLSFVRNSGQPFLFFLFQGHAFIHSSHPKIHLLLKIPYSPVFAKPSSALAFSELFLISSASSVASIVA